MIGDRENRDDDYEVPEVDHGPLDAMVRMEPPEDLPVPAWVERHGTVVIVRHTHGTGPNVLRESYCSSVAAAVVHYAREVGRLQARGYRVVGL